MICHGLHAFLVRYLDERLEEEQLMRSLVEMVLGGRENAKEAKKKLVQYKSKIVQEVNEESKELMRQALEEVSVLAYLVRRCYVFPLRTILLSGLETFLWPDA